LGLQKPKAERPDLGWRLFNAPGAEGRRHKAKPDQQYGQPNGQVGVGETQRKRDLDGVM